MEMPLDFYHVTEQENVPNILKNGLLPPILSGKSIRETPGKSYLSLKDRKRAVFVFSNAPDFVDLTNCLLPNKKMAEIALLKIKNFPYFGPHNPNFKIDPDCGAASDGFYYYLGSVPAKYIFLEEKFGMGYFFKKKENGNELPQREYKIGFTTIRHCY